MSQDEIRGVLRIYAAGGCGLNIASFFDGAGIEPGHSKAEIVYVDTSHSNLRDGINPNSIYLLDDVDGSGKIRKENHAAISKTVRDIVQKHAPGDLNVVVFSASGGSGSVFGPLIMSELLERDKTVVGIVVGSDESNITATNTMNTLKSLEAIAKKHSKPVVVNYSMNSNDVPRSKVDVECRHVISALSILGSKQNAELDSRDVANWVYFQRSTTAEAQLATFEVYLDGAEAARAPNPISIASLYDDTDAKQIELTPEYVTVGYPRNKIKDISSLHFIISLDGIHTISKLIQKRVEVMNQQRDSRVKHESILSSKDQVTDDGLVL